ncbi:hypothetical protein HPB51_008704 [Rhipicephalus microplus]|uniref:Hexosyltransferase n=1 Tax=Rhipicephalus microplus TaxID=6941 RepID=A0A9J6F021_RHIMP|nr:hypothetical protein HPB51_008704 [Rhipicephalus microplus]
MLTLSLCQMSRRIDNGVDLRCKAAVERLQGLEAQKNEKLGTLTTQWTCRDASTGYLQEPRTTDLSYVWMASTPKPAFGELSNNVNISTAEPTHAQPSDSLNISKYEPTLVELSDTLKTSAARPSSVGPHTEGTVKVTPDINTMTTNKIASGAPVPIVNTSTSAFVDAGNLTKVPGWKLKSTCGFPLRVLYFVHTAPAHFYRRRVLRDTIGDPTVAAFVNSTIAFFVGKTSNTDVSEEVRAEAECEGDLVLLDHVDTYRNLTLKFIGATKWLTANHCLSSSTNVVVKLDDDVLVNVFLLAYYVERHMNAAETRNWRTIHCATSLYLKPFRDKNSKWFVTKEEYANDTYPPFCYGAAYLMKASVLVLLGEATGSVPFFWVDDVYSTDC